MSRRALSTLAAGLALAAALASPGQPSQLASDAKCLKPRTALVKAIKSGLRAKARGKLRKARAVKARPLTGFAPRGFKKGTYFVSAKMRGFGIATWAADRPAYNTGGGLIISVGRVARRVSTLGVDIPRSTLEAWGLTTHTRGYAASRRCVRK